MFRYNHIHQGKSLYALFSW